MKHTSSKHLAKTSTGIAGFIIVVAIVVGVNVLLGNANFRKDLTEDKIYSLSDSTRKILSELDTDIRLKFFFNSSSAEVPAPLKSFAQQVLDLLKEYEIASNGHVIVEKYDPKPDSDAEDWAQRYGLAGQPMGLMGPVLYCGLVAVSGDQEKVMPVIDPSSEQQLEYDITRLITQLANPEKPVLGVLSTLPVLGTKPPPFAMPGQPQPRPEPAWVTFSEMQQDYDVRTIEPDTDLIPDEIDALVVVHPKDLSDQTLYAIDQFIMRGGRLIAFMDPFCIVDAFTAGQSPYGMPKTSSSLGKLLDTWGVTFSSTEIVADMDAITQVMGRGNKVEDNPGWLSLRHDNVNESDILTFGLESLLLAYSGAFTVKAPDGVEVTTLFQSSTDSDLEPATLAQLGSNAIRRDFERSDTKHDLAVRLHGKFTSAFPEGKPAPEPAEGEDEPENTQPEESLPTIKACEKPATIILVGDVDMLYDQFCVRETGFLGFKAFAPINDNIVFAANAVEQLVGSEDLVGIRSRGHSRRPFEKVLELQRAAQGRWMHEEKMLQEKLNELQSKLSALQQTRKDQDQRFILTPEQEQEIKQFRVEQKNTKDRLKEVRRNLRKDIERLGVKIKLVNILLMPALVCIAGIAFAVYRKMKIKAETITGSN